MAKPRIFISSTIYDWKYVRASLQSLVLSLGFEPLLSENGDIAYTPDITTEESCYRDIATADIYVLIVGKRYGSQINDEPKRKYSTGKEAFYEKYTSITRQEFRTAQREKIPTYILVEKSVDNEHRTWQANKNSSDVNYVHVESVNVFEFLDETQAAVINKATNTFDNYADIEEWLRSQWAGYFHELLKKVSTERQIAGLSQKVDELANITELLKSHLETLMKYSSVEGVEAIIQQENERLAKANYIAEVKATIQNDPHVNSLLRQGGIEQDTFAHVLYKSDTKDEFEDNLIAKISVSLTEKEFEVVQKGIKGFGNTWWSIYKKPRI